jgi:phosphate starvation-inducible PhoH-like protein
VVPVEEDIGFLPGNLNKKMDPWTRPIIDIFEEYYTKPNINNMILNGQIEISPLGFMRGRTFKNAFIIADEMQNSSPNQMYMLLTRIGTNSRLVITGDLEQSDKLEKNGLKDLVNKLKNTELKLNNIMLIELNNTDIQRSELVNQIVKLYDSKPIKINNVIITNKTVPNQIIPVKKYINENINNDSALIPRSHMNNLIY